MLHHHNDHYDNRRPDHHHDHHDNAKLFHHDDDHRGRLQLGLERVGLDLRLLYTRKFL